MRRQLGQARSCKVGADRAWLSDSEMNYSCMLMSLQFLSPGHAIGDAVARANGAMNYKEELTIPLWANLSAHALCEALDGEFGSMIPRVTREPHEAAHAADLNDNTTLLAGYSVDLAHDAHCVQGELSDAPEIGLACWKIVKTGENDQ